MVTLHLTNEQYGRLIEVVMLHTPELADELIGSEQKPKPEPIASKKAPSPLTVDEYAPADYGWEDHFITELGETS